MAINPDIKVFIRSLDVDNHDQVFEVVKAFAEDLGSLDRVLSLTPEWVKVHQLAQVIFKANKQTAETNFVSAISSVRSGDGSVPRKQNAGHLVTISSMSAMRGARRAMTVYAATKAGLSSMTEGIRIDVHEYTQ